MYLPKRPLVESGRAYCLLALIFVGCDSTFSPSIRGSDVAKTETRAVSPFSEIDVGGGIQLDVTIGPTSSLAVTADDNILPHLKTDVAGDRLTIYVDASYSTNLGVVVQATAPTLRALQGSGASKTMLTGLSGEQFHLDLSGASTCQLTGDADLIDAKLSGASHGAIAGTAKQVSIDCSGASHLDAAGLTAEKIIAEVSGASTAHVHATKELEVTASGASTLRYAGHPAKLDEQTSGASTVAPE
jgi:hypothetical protein